MTKIATQPAYSARLSEFLGREHKLLIDGRWVASTGSARIPVVDPSTGRQIAEVPDATSEDVDRAVTAAARAVREKRWSGLTPNDRERIMLRFVELMEQHAEELSEIEAADNGKPAWVVRTQDIPGAMAELRYAAGWATKLPGDLVTPVLSPPGTFHAYTVREPVGVVGIIIPWNYPIAMIGLKLAPALAAGCCVVLKPAEQTPLSALRLGELALEAGVPDGVLNILTGVGKNAGDQLVRHPNVNKVTFTGSTVVGKQIMRTAADTLKRVTLELGGKSPVVVMPDFDAGEAGRGVADMAIVNTGQLCVAATRLYAHRSVFDRVLEGVADQVTSAVLGPGLDESSQLGPVISQLQQERVMDFIDSARTEGATIVAGGDGISADGYFVPPTVLADVTPDMRVMRDEIFGPVLCVSRFDDIDDVLNQANDTPYGLAASIWTHDISTMFKAASRLQAGAIFGNCHAAIDPAVPLGGFKQSGFGRERGLEGVLAFTELKSVTIKL